MAGRGFPSPMEGQEALGGNYTVWLLFQDGLWRSPKDESGLPRVLSTPFHVKALAGQFIERVDLPRSRKSK